MSLIRLEGVVREIGTFVILDQVTAAIAPGEQVWLVRPGAARRRCSASRRGSTSRTGAWRRAGGG